MKLRRLALLGTLLTPVLLGCSDDATVLSVNINLSSDKLDRSNPSAWSPISISVAGRALPTTIAIQTETVNVEVTDANGMTSMMATTQVKGRWFQRIDLPGGYADGGAVVASATGAYKQTSKVGDMDVTTIVSDYQFSTEKKPGDKDATIDVDPDAAVIDEVSALFLNFNAPEPEAPPPAGGSGGGGAPATGGAPAATGGAPEATGGSPAATGGAPEATGGTAPAGGGGTEAGGADGAGGNGGTPSENGGGSAGGGAGGTSAGSSS